jgi:predicted nucleic acid-binding protein
LIYLDTSVALAHLLAEDRCPPLSLWRQPLVSSRLLVYELWTVIHSRGLAATHSETAQQLLRRLTFVELLPSVLSRALQPFPVPVRTLDALHLASVAFLREQGVDVSLASYDTRMSEAARQMAFPMAPV